MTLPEERSLNRPSKDNLKRRQVKTDNLRFFNRIFQESLEILSKLF